MKIDDLSILHLLYPLLQLLIGGERHLIFAFGSQKMTLEQYSEAKINSTEGQILESNLTTLTDLPAHEIVFTNAGLQKIQVWTIKDVEYSLLHMRQMKKISKMICWLLRE
jgi:hypothetical protein